MFELYECIRLLNTKHLVDLLRKTKLIHDKHEFDDILELLEKEEDE